MKTQYVGFKNSAKYVCYSNVVNIIRFYSNYYCSQISNSIISKGLPRHPVPSKS